MSRKPFWQRILGRTEAPAPQPSKPPGAPRGRGISHIDLARSRVSKGGDAAVNPFTLPTHPPSVIPPSLTIAQDDAITATAQWAAGAIEGMLGEGLQFLGYAFLAELAQRPEYRRISETLATEMTRKWIKLQASGDIDKSKKITRINAVMEHLGIRDVFRAAAEQDGFFGRGHLYIDLGTSDDPEELLTPIGDGRDKVSLSKVGKGSLKRLGPVEAVWCYPSGYNTANPLYPDWYAPQFWFVQGRKVHASRLLTFIGRRVPDLLKPSYAFGGLSMSQMAKPYVDNWLRTRQSVADLISSFSVSGLKTNLTDALNANGGDAVFSRAQFFNNMRQNNGMLLVDKETEEFFNVSTPLGTLDHLQAQSQEHMSSVAGIPLVKLLGITPSGLNASSDGEVRVFYDWIHAYQEQLFTGNLKRILGFVQLSEFGEIDPEISFTYEPLWSLDETAKADVQRTEAETDKLLIDSGTISPEESRRRVAADPDTTFAGLDLDLAPDLSEPEQAEVGTKRAAAIIAAFEAALIDKPTALRELQTTGMFHNIDEELITEAENEPPPPTELAQPPAPGGTFGKSPVPDPLKQAEREAKMEPGQGT